MTILLFFYSFFPIFLFLSNLFVETERIGTCKYFSKNLKYNKNFSSQNIETQPKSSLLKKEISIEEQLLGKDFSDYQLNKLKKIFETRHDLENFENCEKTMEAKISKINTNHNPINRVS